MKGAEKLKKLYMTSLSATQPFSATQQPNDPLGVH